jgi:hypothetical protein
MLIRLISDWWGPLQPGDGCSAEELDAAEERLGVKLPAAVRELYGICGKVGTWKMMPLERIDWVDDGTGDPLLSLFLPLGPTAWCIGARRSACAEPDPFLEELAALIPSAPTRLSDFAAKRTLQGFVHRFAFRRMLPLTESRLSILRSRGREFDGDPAPSSGRYVVGPKLVAWFGPAHDGDGDILIFNAPTDEALAEAEALFAEA